MAPDHILHKKPEAIKFDSPPIKTKADPRNDLHTSLTHPGVPAPSDPTLTPQQSLIVERIIRGENVFFTGSAGTGKSVLLRAIIRAIRDRAAAAQQTALAEQMVSTQGDLRRELPPNDEQGERERWTLGVTASTGIAAV